MIDGQTVYPEEVVWHPKTSEDLSYQYDGIVSAFKTAAFQAAAGRRNRRLVRGDVRGNSPMVSSLFLEDPAARSARAGQVHL